VGLLSALAMALMLFNSASAQVASYGLSQLTGQTYQSLTGGTVITDAAQLTSGTSDDGFLHVVLPFAFPYNGTTFDSVTFSTNYWIAFRHQSPTALEGRTSSNLFSATLPNNTLAPFFRDGNANFGTTGQGEMRHGLVGTTGVYVFEWFQATGNGFSISGTQRLTFQVRLHGPASTNPGRIEYAYGPSQGTISTGATSIGIENATGGTGNYLNAVNGLSNNTATTTTFPGNGFVYRFDPPAPMVFNGAQVLGVNNNPTLRGATNVPMYVVNVSTLNALTPLSVSSITVNPLTQNIANIDSVKIFYTGSSSTFSTATQFGSALGSVTTGANAIAGTQNLNPGNNFFWITYNVSNTAVLNDSLSGQVTSVTVAGTPQTPTVTQSSTRRLIREPLSGTYTVGTGGQYANLGAVFVDINSLGLSANVNLDIISNITEPASAGLNQWAEQGAGGYTLTIRPTGPNRVISGNIPGSGVITLIGADRVIIDGRIGGTGTGRDLTIRNEDNSAINVAVLLAGQTTAVGGCNDVTIRNTNLWAGPTAGTTLGTAGIQVQGTGAPGQNLIITNNEFRRAYRAVYVGVNAPTANYRGLQITNNIIGSNDPTEIIGGKGIEVGRATGALIQGNHIFNVGGDLSITAAGIDLITGADSATILNNKIYTVRTFSAAYGIQLSAGNGHLLVNNDIANIQTRNSSATTQLTNAFGFRISAGTGHRLFHNTVHMSGDYTSTNATVAGSAAVSITATTVTAQIRNNVFSNTITSNATGNKNMFIYWLPDGYNFANLGSTNFNNYHLGSESYHFFAQRGTTFNTNRIATFAAWQTASARDTNSLAVNPRFLSTTSGLPNSTAMNNQGTPIATVTTDVNGATRSTTTPDMGAHEYTPIPKDVAAVSLSRNNVGCFTNAEPIRAIVRNTGADTLNFGTDTLRITLNMTGTASATVNFTRSSGVLAPNDTLHLILGSVNMSAFGSYVLNATVNQQNDGFANNNAFGALSLQNVAPISIPFAANFDGPTNNSIAALQAQGWTIASPWIVGAGGHGNPGNGLYVNIYNSTANLTPSFTLPLAGPIFPASSFQFSYRLLNFSSYPANTYTPSAADSIWFEASTDCGVSWQRLYKIDSSSHIVDTLWRNISIPMASYAGQNVLIRVRSQWATGDYYFDMDNVGIALPLNAFNLVAPANNARVVAAGSSSATINVNWTRAVQGPATYTWVVDLPNGNFSTPLVALPANNNGLDTNLTLTIGQIHALLGSLNVAIGDSVDIIWSVRAQLGTQSLLAAAPRSARLVRGALAPLRAAIAPTFTNSATGTRGPTGASAQAFLRVAAIVTKSELAAASIDSGTSLVNVSFRATTGAASAVRGRMIMYMRNASDTVSVYSRGAAWTGAIQGLQVVHDDSLTVRTTPGLMTLNFTQPFVYTGGALELAYEWAATGPFAATGAAYAANSARPSSSAAAQSATVFPTNLTTTTNSQFRPELTWGADDRKENDLEVITLFARGQNPRQWGAPEVVQAIVRNNSYVVRNNVAVTLNVAGANTFTNTQTIATLGVDSSTLVTFSGFSGTALGFNNLTVSVPNDERNSNNSRVWAQQQTDSIYSYNDTVTAGLGSVGYNTGSGLLLARFSVNGHRSIRAARMRIGQAPEIVGNALSAVVTNDSGVIIAQSAPITIATGQLNTWVVFTFPNPVNINNGNFFIGMAQPANATGYFPMAFQAENPTRANAYFTAPLIGGVPAPVTGFRLMIEAHVGAPVIPVDSLSRFSLVAPGNNTVVNLQGDPAQTVNIRWNQSRRSVGTTPVTYQWLLDLPGTTFTNPVVRVNAGTDTSLTFTYGQIVDTLAAKGIAVGAGFVGRWTVRATSDSLNRLATLPFNITLNRGVMTSIEETDFSKSIVIYPNPAAYTAKLQVTGSDKDLAITVVNAVGQEMKKFTVNSGVRNEIEIDLANLNEGLYFVRISDGSNMAIKRLMIQR